MCDSYTMLCGVAGVSNRCVPLTPPSLLMWTWGHEKTAERQTAQGKKQHGDRELLT